MDNDDDKNSDIRIRKKSFVLSIVIVAVLSSVLISSNLITPTFTSVVSSNTTTEEAEVEQVEPQRSNGTIIHDRMQQLSPITENRSLTPNPKLILESALPQIQCEGLGTTEILQERRTYPIFFTTLEEAKSQFRFSEGKEFADAAGLTEWFPDYRVNTNNRGIITCAIVVVVITTTLPSWEDDSSLCQCIRDKMNEFLSAVIRHESGHTDLVHSYLTNIHETLIGKTNAIARADWYNTLKSLNVASKEYDRMNEHGKTQGAELIDTACNNVNGCACSPSVPIDTKLTSTQLVIQGTICNNQCVNTGADRLNCGNCGSICGEGKICHEGTCECPGDLDNYVGRCIPKCTGGQVHTGINGECRCPFGLQLIEGQCKIAQRPICHSGLKDCIVDNVLQCTNLNSDEANCGDCGKTCSANQLCINSQCRSECRYCDANNPCPTGTVCARANKCYSYSPAQYNETIPCGQPGSAVYTCPANTEGFRPPGAPACHGTVCINFSEC